MRANFTPKGDTRYISTSHVPELEELLVQAVEMYLMDEEERIVKTSNYEGKLYTQRRHEILGGFGGQRFDAELETAQGRDSATVWPSSLRNFSIPGDRFTLGPTTSGLESSESS